MSELPEDVATYVDAIDVAHRSLFDRVHGLIVSTFPDVEIAISYQMPTYRREGRRLYVGTWKHGVSLYGWSAGGDGGFSGRHPELVHGKGTIRIRPDEAAELDDKELANLIDAVLGDS